MNATVKLDVFEYAVFLVTLALSALIGVYYGCIKTTGQNTVTGYLFGGKRMPVIPVALSLVSSFISGITLIGLPSEVYFFSTQYLVVIICMVIATCVQVYGSLPVFFKLQLVSTFEYMELRFGRRVRTITSLLYCLSVVIGHSAIVIYGPALAVNQVTGIGIHTISIGVGVVCIFYTTIGGLKAVVWTDTLQSVIMMFSVLTVLTVGVIQSGGILAVMEAALEGDRLVFFNMDPTARISFWSQIFGATALNISNTAFHPAIIQRLTSLPSMKDAVRSSWLMVLGVNFFFLTSGYLGLVMYTYYRNCDPYTAKLISQQDQIVPYFIMEITTFFRGLCGLFLAGIVSAALSSLSTAINTLAGTIYDDFIECLFKQSPGEEAASRIIKFTSLIIGVTCVALVSLVERMGSMLEIAAGFTGVANGAIVGLFLLGFFNPYANNKGAAIGGVTSFIFMAIILTGYVVNKMKGAIHVEHSKMSIDGCPFNVTLSPPDKSTMMDEEVFPLFKVPLFFYTFIGNLIVITAGSLASYLLRSDKEIANLDCLSPWARRFAKRPGEATATYNSVSAVEDSMPLSQLNVEQK